MTSSLGSRHIPTIVGVLVLVGGLIGGIFLTNSATTGFLPRASPETTPKSVKVTNISDTSFSVSWITDSKVSGYIKYGTSNSLSLTSVDDRDQVSGSTGAYRTHHITIRGLNPSTTYYYKLGSSSSFLYDDSGRPYQTMTSVPISSNAKTVYGQILTATQAGAGGVLVYVNATDMAPLSTLTQSSGSFVISLSQARNKTLTQASPLSDVSPIEILLQGEDGTTSTIKTLLNQAQPLPETILGTSKDFTTSTNEQSSPSPTPITNPKEIQSKFTAQLLAPPTEIIVPTPLLMIASPAEQSILTQPKPIFSGNFAKNSRVLLRLTGPINLSLTATSNSTGSWSTATTKSLVSGDYTLTATATSSGTTETKTTTFALAIPTPSPKASVAKSETPTSLPVAGSPMLSIAIFLSGALLVASGLLFGFNKFSDQKLPY